MYVLDPPFLLDGGWFRGEAFADIEGVLGENQRSLFIHRTQKNHTKGERG